MQTPVKAPLPLPGEAGTGRYSPGTGHRGPGTEDNLQSSMQGSVDTRA